MALLKVEAQGLNALPLTDDNALAINSDVVTVSYPAVIASYTDHDLVPTFNPGTISSTRPWRTDCSLCSSSAPGCPAGCRVDPHRQPRRRGRGDQQLGLYR